MSSQPRADRKPYDVIVRRGHWVGWYYTPEGDRVTNVPLYEGGVGKGLGPRLPVLTTNPLKCPNRNRALEAIRRIAEMPTAARVAIPTLRDAIDQWQAFLVTQGCAEASATERAQLLRSTLDGLRSPGMNPKIGERKVIVQGVGWRRITQLNRRDLEGFIDRLAAAGRAISTRNVYLTNWGTFARWLLHKEYILNKPLDGLLKGKQRVDKRPRRPFTLAEFEVLVATAPRDDRDYYLCLGLAGLRRDESLRLRKEDMEPLIERPCWRLPAKIQKVKLNKRLPMMQRLATAIGQRWLNLPERGLLFPDAPSRWAFDRLLTSCGIARINADGEALSWHSFRQFFATQVAKKVGMRRVQELMRHHSIQLTMDLYRKLHLEDIDDTWTCPDI